MGRMRTRPANTVAVADYRSENGPTSFVASAIRYGESTRFKDYSQLAQQETGWQKEAWRLYHVIGEFRYSCDWVGGMLSKALVHATEYVEQRVRQVAANHPAARVVDDLFGDPDGRSEMFRLLGIHFSVTGEAIIMVYPDPSRSDGADYWRVLSSTEVRNHGTQALPVWHIHGQPLPEDVNPAEVLVVRVWRPDPEDPRRAISPARAVLSTLGEIERLSDHLAAQIDSRLAGAGILMLPSDITLPSQAPPPDGSKVLKLNTADEVMAVLQQVMAASIRNRGSAAAAVPIVLTCPADVIDKIQHLTFWSELDEHVIELRNEAIRRLALGMDMPPEVLQGLSESNHWSAWQADESSIKAHTEPLLKIITSALAEGILRPAMRDMVERGELPVDTIVERFSIGVDTSEMRLRPNRSKEALELYQMGLINKASVIRETGFEDEDMMSDEERQEWLLFRLAGGSATPDLVAGALRKLGVEMRVLDVVEEGEVVEAPSQPSLREHPVQDIPDIERSVRRKEARERGDVPSAQSAALVAAADQIVVRAMERAGNKLKTALKLSDGGNLRASGLYLSVDTTGVDHKFLLDDAWAHVPTVAHRYGIDPTALTASLTGYCHRLLETKTPHDYEAFEHWMNTALEGIQA